MDKMKTAWDLTPLFASDHDPEIEKKRKEVEKASYRFIKKWKKRDEYLKNPKVLKEALDEYENWTRLYGANSQEQYYLDLRTSQDENSPQLKGKFNKAREFGIKIRNDINFFELKIAKIPPNLQKKFLLSPKLKPYKHFLEKLFIESKYLLSQEEEKIMNLKSGPSYLNWIKMLSGFLSREQVKVLDEDGKMKVKNFSDLSGLMRSKKKKVRDTASDSYNNILEKYIDVSEHEINSVLQNKKINDEIRGYERADKARHIGDDVETEVVDALIKVVSDNFDIPQSYYRLKARLMKVPKLAYHERNVEYGRIEKKYSYDKALVILKNVFSSLDSTFAKIFEGFVKEGRIDVYPRKNKVGGAFCNYGLLIHPSYSLLNWTDKLNDVLTLAHEMGHGINFELVKKKENALNFGTTIATTEVASTFMEDFVLRQLLREGDDELKLSVSMMKLNDDVSSIFRQVALYNFETDLNRQVRSLGYLSKEKIGNLFQKHMRAYMGPYVAQSEGSQNWWVSWHHIRYFFYVYSYASGLLISKSLQASVKKDPRFISRVKEFLSIGLSDSPKNIFAKLGIDITDKTFWEKGLNEVEGLLNETETLAKKLKKI